MDEIVVVGIGDVGGWGEDVGGIAWEGVKDETRG